MSYTHDIIKNLSEKSLKSKAANLKYFKGISPKKQKQLDQAIQAIHAEVFDEVDCLECAACCKYLGPRITSKDIQRLAKHFRMKEVAFIDSYLRIDEDKDYVFNAMPCPFLMEDNYCSVYENRPKACREYPHTDRVNFYQIHKLSIKNSETCPAVYEILNRLRASF
jgi:Fe-S-cluster containining protein